MSVVFKDKTVLARHIASRMAFPSPVRLHKSLYLLSILYIQTFDHDPTYPERLFDDKFEAWVHGPVERDIYNDPNFKADRMFTIKASGLHTQDPLPEGLTSHQLMNLFKMIEPFAEATEQLSKWSLINASRKYDSYKQALKNKKAPYISHDAIRRDALKEKDHQITQ